MLRCPRCHWLLPDGTAPRGRCPACDEQLCGRVFWRARRSSPRVPVRLSAWVRVAGGAANRAVIWDLSTIGARWWGNYPRGASPGDVVHLEITFPGRGQPLTVRARAVWVAPSVGGIWCGVRFLKVPDAGFLARYLVSRKKALPLYRSLAALS